MTVHLVTFSDKSMSRSRDLCVRSARHYGVDEAHEYEPSGVASAFIGHESIWNNPKGCGLWAWKPMIINAQLGYVTNEVNAQSGYLPDGDILIYSDAGVEFINNVSHIIERMDQDIFLFGNNWEHAHWCKRDVIDAVWPWKPDAEFLVRAHASGLDPSLRESVQNEARIKPWERFGKQVQASVIFFRVNDWTRAFVKEWLDWCLMSTVKALESKGLSCFQRVMYGKDAYLIDDSPSIFPNHPEFQEHRHDQAILTTMAYREGLKLHYWPAQYNDGAFSYQKLPCYAGDDYPILFHHHRKRNHEWSNAA